jgi:hypothetical protein
MNKNIFVTVCLFLLVNSLTGIKIVHAEWTCTDGAKCAAWNAFQEAVNLHYAGDWQGAAASIRDAIKVIPADSATLKLNGETMRIIDSSGARPKIAKTPESNIVDYYPNRILRQIKAEHPPKIELLVKLGCSGSALCFGERNSGSKDKSIIVELVNVGEMELENLSVNMSSGGRKVSADFGDLSPGKKKKESMAMAVGSELTFQFSEKFNLAPDSITIRIN